jgi:uncharacterized membrane protein
MIKMDKTVAAIAMILVGALISAYGPRMGERVANSKNAKNTTGMKLKMMFVAIGMILMFIGMALIMKDRPIYGP